MDRILVQPSEIPTDTMFLATNKNAMVALGYLAQAVLGSSTAVDGFACVPTTPASLAVLLSTGSIYSFQNIDSTAYGTIGPDTSDQIVKQGVLLGNTTLSCPAPATTGQSINYLIQIAFSETDTNAQNIQFYNSANPAVPLTQNINTLRQATCILSAKAGASATTGTQTTPSPDAGYAGLYVVTVANGQSTITSGNIAQLSTAPFISPKITGVLAALQSGAAIYAADSSGSANIITVNLSPAVTSLVAGLRVNVKVANSNTGATVINTNGLGNIVAITQDGNALPPGAVKANGLYTFIFDGASWQLQAPQAGDIAVGQCVLQYASSSTISLVPKNGNRVSFPNGTMQSIGGGISTSYNNCAVNGTPGQTLSANTLYYAYLVAGSNAFIDFSTTAYGIDSTSGITIKNGDATRVLVGMANTDGTGKFVQSSGNVSGVTASLGVRSWFNDRGVNLSNSFTTTRSTASNAFTEVNSEIRCTVLTWAGESVSANLTGTAANTTSGDGVQTGIGIDSTSLPQMGYTTITSTAASVNMPASAITPSVTPAEGSHFLTMLGNNNNGIAAGGTANWSSVTTLNVQTKR